MSTHACDLPSSPDHRPVDLSWRPDDYTFTVNAYLQRVLAIKGEARRDFAVKLLSGHLHTGLADISLAPSLSQAMRELLMRKDPRLAAGEFLPDRRPDEVEIARVVLETRHRDVVAVYARREGPGWQLRLVDEYGGESLGRRTALFALRPLSTGELVEFRPITSPTCSRAPWAARSPTNSPFPYVPPITASCMHSATSASGGRSGGSTLNQ